jgi:hypothetical protein
MKTFNKILVSLGFIALTGLTLTFNADAQRRGGGGGFGGGSRGGFSGGSRGGFGGGGGFSGRQGGGFGGGGFQGRSNGGFSQRGGNDSRFSQRGGGQRQSFGNRPSYGVRPNGGFQQRGYSRGNFGQSRGAYSYRGNGVRPGFYGRGGYRGGLRGSYFGGRGYYRGGIRGYYGGAGYNGFYHNYRGYYNQFYYPRLGFSIGVLPYGYYPFSWGGNPYFYSNGYYYQQFNNQYTVVEPPVGAEINQLPSDAEQITIDGQEYYESNGVYYLPITKANGRLVYRVAGKDGELNTEAGSNNNQVMGDDATNYPQVGDVIDELPEDSRKVTVNGDKYFVTPDGVYLHEQRDSNGKKIYVVTGIPGDDQEDN